MTGHLKDSGWSKRNYKAFLPYLGPHYVNLDNQIDLYRRVRCGLVHEYFVKGHSKIAVMRDLCSFLHYFLRHLSWNLFRSGKTKRKTLQSLDKDKGTCCLHHKHHNNCCYLHRVYPMAEMTIARARLGSFKTIIAQETINVNH